MDTILISACLCGIPCRYDGQLASNQLNHDILKKIIKIYQIVPVCPEQLSGLSTPRKSVEIQGGDGFDVLKGIAAVKSKDGENLTSYFIKGGELTLKIAKIVNAKKMITQKNSPSCSSEKIYNGSFTSGLKKGYGTCTAYLKLNGLELIDIDQFKILCVSGSDGV
jgi:uncharacterized protein YbbK (DUF523 family)